MSPPRRFAPIGSNSTSSDAPILRGIVFDVDGTMCLPQNWMFKMMRDALGITKQTDILDHIYSLPSGPREVAMEKVRNIEIDAMSKQEPQVGLVKIMEWLDEKQVRKGICTRNFDRPVNHLLKTHLPESVFDPIITREFRPPKPHPAGILHIVSKWAELDGWKLPNNGSATDDSSAVAEGRPAKADPTFKNSSAAIVNEDSYTSAALREDSKTAKKGASIPCIMVGDSIDDMTAGHRAGAATVLLVNEANAHLSTHEHTDLCISQLDELIDVLSKGFVGQIGEEDESSDLRTGTEGTLKS